jgi:hypothetical protein
MSRRVGFAPAVGFRNLGVGRRQVGQRHRLHVDHRAGGRQRDRGAGRGFLLNNALTDFSLAPVTAGVPDPNLPDPVDGLLPGLVAVVSMVATKRRQRIGDLVARILVRPSGRQWDGELRLSGRSSSARLPPVKDFWLPSLPLGAL